MRHRQHIPSRYSHDMIIFCYFFSSSSVSFLPPRLFLFPAVPMPLAERLNIMRSVSLTRLNGGLNSAPVLSVHIFTRDDQVELIAIEKEKKRTKELAVSSAGFFD